MIGELTVANRILKKSGRFDLSGEQRKTIEMEIKTFDKARIRDILEMLDIPRSRWRYKPVADEKRKKRGGGAKAKPVEKHIEEAIVSTAMLCPWYGYKKIFDLGQHIFGDFCFERVSERRKIG